MINVSTESTIAKVRVKEIDSGTLANAIGDEKTSVANEDLYAIDIDNPLFIKTKLIHQSTIEDPSITTDKIISQCKGRPVNGSKVSIINSCVSKAKPTCYHHPNHKIHH